MGNEYERDDGKPGALKHAARVSAHAERHIEDQTRESMEHRKKMKFF